MYLILSSCTKGGEITPYVEVTDPVTGLVTVGTGFKSNDKRDQKDTNDDERRGVLIIEGGDDKEDDDHIMNGDGDDGTGDSSNEDAADHLSEMTDLGV